MTAASQCDSRNYATMYLARNLARNPESGILGAATGPIPMSPLKGGAAAVSSSIATDVLTGEPLMSFQDGGVQFANGAGATIIATASGTGPLGQIAIAGASKFILDEGASLVVTDEPMTTIAD